MLVRWWPGQQLTRWKVLWTPASPILDSKPGTGRPSSMWLEWTVSSVFGDLTPFFSEAQQCKPNCAHLAHRTVMTEEGDRGRGPLGGPSVPSTRDGASQRKEVNKNGRRFCIVFVRLGTLRNHRQPPDPTQAS